MRVPNRLCRLPMAVCALLAAMPGGVLAAELRLTLQHQGKPVADAVVELLDDAAPPPAPTPAVMDQVNVEFVPRQLVVTRGSPVSFPNSDSTRHQVYSFSPAKRFELPLYSGTPPAPVTFESAGVVTLGCNIHDGMIGFIVVVESARWAVSDAEGRLRFADLAGGTQRLRLWHERLAGGQQERELELAADGEQEVRIELQLDPPPPPRGSDRLRALQERLRERQRDPA